MFFEPGTLLLRRSEVNRYVVVDVDRVDLRRLDLFPRRLQLLELRGDLFRRLWCSRSIAHQDRRQFAELAFELDRREPQVVSLELVFPEELEQLLLIERSLRVAIVQEDVALSLSILIEVDDRDRDLVIFSLLLVVTDQQPLMPTDQPSGAFVPDRRYQPAEHFKTPLELLTRVRRDFPRIVISQANLRPLDAPDLVVLERAQCELAASVRV